MLYEDSQKEIHIGGVINKQCVLWRMSRLCLGIINPAPGGAKHCLFCCFVFLFYICLFPAHRDSDQSLINEDGLQTWFNDFKQVCNCVWMQSELYERSMIYVWLTLVWTFPLGSEPFFPFAYVQLPNFMTLWWLYVLLAVSNGPLWGNENQSPQETPISPLTEHVLIYFLLKLRMCSIAVIVEEGACVLLWFMWFLCGLSGCQRSDRSHIFIYYSSLGLAQRVDLEFCTSDMHVCTVHRAKRWDILAIAFIFRILF